MVDLLIKNGILLTMDARRRIIRGGSVAINDGRIVDIGKTDRLSLHEADREIDAKGKAVLPGFINAHAHIRHVLVRGMRDDLPIDPRVEPRQATSFTEDDCFNGAMLACSEMLKAGITCVLENNSYNVDRKNTDRIAQAIERMGMRAIIAPAYNDIDLSLPEDLRFTVQEAVKEYVRMIEEWDGKADGRIKIWLGPTQPGINVSTELLKEIRNLADEYKVGVTVHLSESIQPGAYPRAFLRVIRDKYGFKGHVDYAYDVGLLGPDVLAAHCVWVTNREIQILSSTGTKVVHNPGSNMYLGSGIAPIPRLQSSGIIVALGTDEGQNNLDMFEQMKLTALLQKVEALDPSAITAQTVLEMATIYGAKAIGLEKEIGSLEIGKKADIIIVNMKKPHLVPQHKVTSNIVYAANGSDVDTTIVDGRVIVENRQIKTASEEEILENAVKSAGAILEKSPNSRLAVEPWPVE